MKRICLLFAIIVFYHISYAQQKTDTLNLYFDTDYFQNTKKHLQELRGLKKLKITKITIHAFTDSIATPSYNQQLSNKRAYYTYFSLLNLNFPIKIFAEVKGFGEEGEHYFNLASSRRTEVIYTYTADMPITVNKNKTSEKIEQQLITSQVGEKIIAKNINFYPGSHKVLPQSFPELEKLYQTLKNNPNIKIELIGHICCQNNGLDGYDAITGENRLSVNRAFTVYQYLIENGIKKDRLSYKGLGSKEKLYEFEKNNNEKIANRRVEILIIEK